MTEEEQIAFAMQMSMQDQGKIIFLKQFEDNLLMYSLCNFQMLQLNKPNVQNKMNNQWKLMK